MLQEDGIVNSVVSLISIIVQKYLQQQKLDPSVHPVNTQCNSAAVAVLWSIFFYSSDFRISRRKVQVCACLSPERMDAGLWCGKDEQASAMCNHYLSQSFSGGNKYELSNLV